MNGALALSEPLQSRAGQGGPYASLGGAPVRLLTYDGPVTNDPITIAFRQRIGASQPLRTGAYAKTLTFTLATSTP